MKHEVHFEKVKSKLRKLLIHILRNLQIWAEQVEMIGLSEVRKIPGYHDESLRGKRKGQRSIRLSKSYRAFYITNKDNQLVIVDLIEVNKHEY